MNKEKIIIKALPERFKPKKQTSLEERYEKFANVISQAFEPIIQQLGFQIHINLEKAQAAWNAGKNDEEKRYDLLLTLPKEFWEYTLLPKNTSRRDFAISLARRQISPTIWKTEGKLILLEKAKLDYMYDNDFAISGEVFGSKVMLKQQIVHKVSEQGTPFVQFPARIYKDGEFTPEIVYQDWFEEKGKGLFGDIQKIRALIFARTQFKVGEIFLTENKVKKTEMKKGVWPVSFHKVVEVTKNNLYVQKLPMKVYTLDRKNVSTWDSKRFTAIFVPKDGADAPVEEWPINSTPTKSTLIKRRNTQRWGWYAVERQYDKWRGFKALNPLPRLPVYIVWEEGSNNIIYTTIKGKKYAVEETAYKPSYGGDTIDFSYRLSDKTAEDLGLYKTQTRLYADDREEAANQLLQAIEDHNFEIAVENFTGVSKEKIVVKPSKPISRNKKSQYVQGYEDGINASREYAAKKGFSKGLYDGLQGRYVFPSFDTPVEYQMGFLRGHDSIYEEYKKELS